MIKLIGFKNISIEDFMLLYCLVYICNFYFLDLYFGLIFKYLFFSFIIYGIIRYILNIVLVNKFKIVSTLSSVVLFLLLTFLFSIQSFLSTNQSLITRGLYEYVFYLFIILSTRYFVEKCNIRIAINFLSKYGVILSIIAIYEQISRRYVIGIQTNSYLITSSMVNNNSNGALRAVVFSGSFLGFGILMAIISVVSFYCYLKNKNFFTFIVLIINVIGLLMSMSRGPWMATFITFIVLYINTGDLNEWKFRSKQIIKLFWCFFLFLLILLILSRFVPFIENFSSRLYSIFTWSNEDASNLGRRERWKNAFSIFEQNWIIGIGPASTGSRSSIITESGILKRLVECGFFTTSLYYLFLVDYIRNGIKCAIVQKNQFISVAIGVVVCILVEDIYLQITEEISVYFLMCLFLNILYYNKVNILKE